RAGGVDPGRRVGLLRDARRRVAELGDGLERSSGLAGLAGLPGGSGDMRDVQAAADRGDRDARLAIGVYLHRLCREIAAMAAAMNGLDALAFTGGDRAHEPHARAAGAPRPALRIDSVNGRHQDAPASVAPSPTTPPA